MAAIVHFSDWYFEVGDKTAHWKSSYWDDYATQLNMEFRLIYEGPLPAAGGGKGAGRNSAKHQIRKQLHPQLRQLWTVQRPMSDMLQLGQYHWPDPRTGELTTGSAVDAIAAHHTKYGFRFAPLINKYYGWVCDLDILFLRREEAGAIVNGGDIDNRLKVLFDGLRIPENMEEVKDEKPDADEDPFYCLLE